MTNYPKNLFLTSNPGIGKTTLIKEVCLPFIKDIGGFYTEEIIGEGKRVGFKLKTFSGEEGILAQKGMKSQYKLNKYGIDIKVVENIGVSSIKKALLEKKLVVIDEIGTMECVSLPFREIVVECLNSNKNVLATIRYKSQPFTDEIKQFQNTEIILLTRENFYDVKMRVKKWLEKILAV